MNPNSRLESELEHARWRVRFRQSILQAHRQSTTSGDEWFRKDAEYLQSLKQAKADLFRLERQLARRNLRDSGTMTT